jgi:hypothetical protein
MSRYSEYMAFENSQMEGFNQLMTKYKAVKEKECAVTGQSSGRVQKKEALLRLKENKTITDDERIELDFIDAEDKTKTLYDNNMFIIEKRKEKQLAQAKEDYQKAIAKAEEMYQSTKETYDRQNEQSLARHKKEYDTKKRTVDARKQRIEDERNISIKTAAEIVISQQKIDILTQMQKMIKVLQVSRNSLEQRDKDRLQPLIELPEPIVTQYVHTAPAPVAIVTIPRPMPDISMLGEDADLLAMREENRARRRERDRKREEETTVRKPPVYGFICDLEGREPVKRTYVPKPVTDDTFDIEAHNKEFADIE